MYANILSEKQVILFPFVQSFQKEFYLVGGTAIALQIGHRTSIDFDLFKFSSISKTKIAQRLEEYNFEFQLLFTDSESFHILVDGVKITFFQYPFKIPSKLTFNGVKMPDLLHLAAMKAYALGRRAKWKDYVDLYFLLKYHVTIEDVIEKATVIFHNLFSPKLFRQQLCFFEDIDYTEEVFYLKEAVSESTVKYFLTDISTASI